MHMEDAIFHDLDAVSLRERFKHEMLSSLQSGVQARLARLRSRDHRFTKATLAPRKVEDATSESYSDSFPDEDEDDGQAQPTRVIDTEDVSVETGESDDCQEGPTAAADRRCESTRENAADGQTRPTIDLDRADECIKKAEDSPERRARLLVEDEIEEVFTEGALRAMRTQHAHQRATARQDSEDEMQEESEEEEDNGEDEEEEEEHDEDDEEEEDLHQAYADYMNVHGRSETAVLAELTELDEMMQAMGGNHGMDLEEMMQAMGGSHGDMFSDGDGLDAEDALAALMMAARHGF